VTPPAAVPPAGHQSQRTLFGEIARDLGLVTGAQVAEALRVQEVARAGAAEPAQPPRIGEVLVARRELELRGVQKVLLEQQRRREGQPGAAAPPLKGIGQYEILSVLGSGGMGLVYKARDRDTNRIVALKVLALKLAADAEFVARFEREVKTTSALSHPNIVSSYGAGSDGGRPYLAMEFVPGRTLGDWLEHDGRLREQEALRVARAVASALGCAHARGIVHRDVKPDNVLLGSDGAIKLTDFGLAKLLREDQRLTQSGIAIGTPHYISPEQVAASRYIDHRADLYGLGALLFQMATGQVPFDAPNNNDIMLKHLDGKLRDPRTLVPGLSAGTTAIIMKLMAKKPADRYDTASQLIEDIDLVLASKKTIHAALGHRLRRFKDPGCAVVLALFALCLLCIAGCSL